MAVIKVFDSHGVKELSCFDTLDEVDYMPEVVIETEPEESNPFA